MVTPHIDTRLLTEAQLSPDRAIAPIVSPSGPVLGRQEQMAQETRHVFFSLDGGRACEAPQPLAAECGQQRKPGTDGHGKTKKPFSANFGTKQAWESAPQPAIRTQGVRCENLARGESVSNNFIFASTRFTTSGGVYTYALLNDEPRVAFSSSTAREKRKT